MPNFCFYIAIFRDNLCLFRDPRYLAMTSVIQAETLLPDSAETPLINLATLSRIIFWFTSIMGLGDGLTTWYAIEHSDTSGEGNPIMRWPMEHWGILTACLLKIFFNILIFWWISRRIMGRKLLPDSIHRLADQVWA